MKSLLFSTTKKIFKIFLYLTAGGLIALLAVYVFLLESRAETKVWHKARLDAEYTAQSPVADFTEYTKLEERLFRQLAEEVYDKITPEDHHFLNRFSRGSMSDPKNWPRNWNRTFVLTHDSPKAGILLLHGMSDSPYSLRNIGLHLHEAGATVIGLRLPGHGTAPSGLVAMHWQDMASAVKLAMQYLQAQLTGKPLYIIGYSNGSALAVHYALSALDDKQLPKTEGLVLISPAIGITPLAAFAVWQARLGLLLKLEKLAWQTIALEYDPYKYNSFAVNAGDQIYRLTSEIQRLINKKKDAGSLEQLPPIIAFLSDIDATVSTSAVITGLFEKLPKNGNELVLFDINRINGAEKFFTEDPKPYLNVLLARKDLSYTLTLVANENEGSRQVHLVRKAEGDSEIETLPLELSWPKGIHSLSHVALPFPPTDPLYGENRSTENPGVHLGNISLRGESNVLKVPEDAMLRLRWNPFYSYFEDRIFDFVRLDRP